MADIDGSLVRMSKGSRIPGNANEEWRIIESLASLMGAPRRCESAGEAFAQLVRAWGTPMPMRLEDLSLPGPGLESPQRTHHYFGRRKRPDFKLAYTNREAGHGLPNPASEPPPDGKLRLLWVMHSQGLDHLGSHSQEFDALRPRPKLEINPADAKKLGLSAGDWVALEGGSDRPSQVELNPYLCEGVAYGAANVLGLKLAAGEPGLPAIKLQKTEAPAEAGESAGEAAAS
jgi:anaerobic selenocysteine-containing dehydrogenase